MDNIKQTLHTNSKLTYSINHLLHVAGLNIHECSISEICIDETVCSILINGKKIRFNLFDDSSIKDLINGNHKFEYIQTYDELFMIPISLDKNIPFAVINENVLEVNAEIVTLSFLMLSRFEEQFSIDRDEHGRFKYENSLAFKYDFIDFPLVDEYAIIFKKYLVSFLSKNHFESHVFEVVPTHDIDVIRRFKNSSKTFKTLLSDLIIKKSIKVFLTSLKSLLFLIIRKSSDPYLKSIERLIEISKRHNLISEFYFMSAEKSKYNDGYNIHDEELKSIFSKILSNKMIVGIHGGYETFQNIKILNDEIQRLEEACSCKISNIRQHYLRLDVNHTFEMISKLGLKTDTTMGYAEREGFRSGTCHEYNPYNLKEDKPYSFIERPLILMETTLFGYRKMSNDEAFLKMNFLYSRCKAVGGKFVFLFHNDFVVREPLRFENVYIRFLKHINLSNLIKA